MNYYILGSARCRTYWFSRLFNCYHEWHVLNSGQLPDGAGSAETHVPKGIKGKSVVILRDPIECINSLLTAYPMLVKPKVEEMMADNYVKLLELDSPKYDFHNLDKYIPEIWDYLLDAPVDIKRINEYNSMRLTVEGGY